MARPPKQNRRQPPPRALIVAEEAPDFQKAGHTHVLQNIISQLIAFGFEVHVVVATQRLGFVAEKKGWRGWFIHGPGVREAGEWLVHASPAAVARLLGWRFFFQLPQAVQNMVSVQRDRLRAAGGHNHTIGRFLSSAQAAYVRQCIVDLKPDVVFYNTLFCYPGPQQGRDYAEYIITHDVKHQRAASMRRAGYTVSPPDFDREAEIAVLSQVENLIAIQWDEAATLRAMVPHANVLVVPAAMEAYPRTSHTGFGKSLVFVGSGSLHNVDGIQWFLRKVWPALRTAAPQIQLHVYGSVCARLGDVPDGVILHGIVPDLAPAYDAADVCIVPLKAGSGLKVKLIEALAHGIATVTTSVGAEGLLGLEPRPFFVADDPRAFSDAVSTLLTDVGQRTQVERQAAAAALSFTPENAFSELRADLTRRGVLAGARHRGVAWS